MRVKTIVLGDRAVGKTCFISHIRNDTKNNVYVPTVGVDFTAFHQKFHNVELQIWDTSGSSRFKVVVDSFIIGTQLCIFMYKDERSFGKLMNLIADCKKDEVEKRFCIISTGDHDLADELCSQYGYWHFRINIYNKRECLDVWNTIAKYCRMEQTRVKWIKTDDKPVELKRERDEGYCWWSFC